MSTHEQGRRYEELAVGYLEARGWRILDRNFRSGGNEIDLVMRRGEVLAFVEVKGRRGPGFGHPLEAVTPRKRRDVARVAAAWLRERGGSRVPVVRFDAVAILDREGDGPSVEHVENAWGMG